MGNHEARIEWTRAEGEPFVDNRYSRAHVWTFDGGVIVPASASPSVVPVYSKPENVDPEEAFVAAISSCHLLSFLWVAAKAKVVVDSYVDRAVGVLAKRDGRNSITKVTLAPVIVFGTPITDAEVAHLHERAHEECFIANSVKTEIVVAGSFSIAPG